MPSFAQAEGERALGYTTFPERKRAVSPEGRYQARRISAACEARGMVLHKLVGDVAVLLRPGPPSGPASTTRSTCSARGRRAAWSWPGSTASARPRPTSAP